MAHGTLAEPGTAYGPCAHPCEHTDCAETRKMAAETCRFCNRPISYDAPFYNEGGLVHANCYLKSLES